MNRVDRKALLQKWMHSREEDTETEMVFRPAGYNFPRSRGRAGFELKENDQLVEIGIAPTDAQQKTEGTWRLEGKKLAFYRGSESEPVRVMQVTSVEKDRLVVKK